MSKPKTQPYNLDRPRTETPKRPRPYRRWRHEATQAARRTVVTLNSRWEVVAS